MKGKNDMEITGLPDPPKGYMKDKVEMKRADKGDLILVDKGGPLIWELATARLTGVPFLMAIPVKLTGKSWLDVQLPGTHFVIKATGIQYIFLLNCSGQLTVAAIIGGGKLLWAHHMNGNCWMNLKECFPNGYEDLSDDTCEILYPRP